MYVWIHIYVFFEHVILFYYSHTTGYPRVAFLGKGVVRHVFLK